jgi:hypothetical protein
MSQIPSKLTLLLPTTPYVLAYTLPLLLLSVLLTFAGTFLTIDRSRSFTPRSDASSYSSLPGAFDYPKKKRRFSWLLEGGIGGWRAGTLLVVCLFFHINICKCILTIASFQVHLSTLLVLLIPATSSSAALSSKSFLAVWILSCIVTTFLAGRYRYAAVLLASTSGGYVDLPTHLFSCLTNSITVLYFRSPSA